MLEYLFKVKSARQRCVLLCFFGFMLFFAVHCGNNNDQAVDEKPEVAGNEAVQPLATIKTCALCGKDIRARTACRITLDEGKELNACCSFCAANIRRRIGRQPFDAVTVCYSTGEKIDFKTAYFVVESDETPCCTPSVLAFSSLEEAEKFVAGKSGRIMSVLEVMNYVEQFGKNRE